MAPDPDALRRDAGAVFPDAARNGVVVRSPGRVNLIGDHIDYSGGSVLPFAVDRGTRAVVSARSDRLLRGFSANFPQAGVVSADLSDLSFSPDHGWFSYVLGVVDVLAAAGHRLESGFDLWLRGSIPDGAGLSSSASVELAAAVAAAALGGFDISAGQTAVLCQRAENDYIGVACGVMDQLAIACGREGHALLMDCDTLAVDPIPLPSDVTFVVANSGQRRTLVDSDYNERRRAVGRGLAIINDARAGQNEPVLAGLARASVADVDRSTDALADAGVLPFVRHTVTEQARVVAAADALRAGDVEGVGRLMRQSHESLRDDYAVTGTQLDALASAAWHTPGVIGARMTGAGFGGCTINLLDPGAAPDALPAIAEDYLRATGAECDFLAVTPAAGAAVVA